jgi:methylated-DNA-[protein]-cysteine S-methyltransferase
MISERSMPSPIGALVIAEDGEAIVSIRWGGAQTTSNSPLLAEAARQLEGYFAGSLSRFDLPLKPAGSPFDRRVWAAMQAIPYGKTGTYGDLAHDTSSAPRAVGGACGRNPIPIVIPCHRVLGRAGIGGYSGGTGLDTKRWLLRLEGALPAETPLLRAS